MRGKHERLDWKGLRRALGFTQRQMGELLSVHYLTIHFLENNANRSLNESSWTLLRIGLRDPELQERLRKAKFPHPFPEDINL